MKYWEYGYDSYATTVYDEGSDEFVYMTMDPAAGKNTVSVQASTTNRIVFDEAGVDTLIKRLLAVQRVWKKTEGKR